LKDLLRRPRSSSSAVFSIWVSSEVVKCGWRGCYGPPASRGVGAGLISLSRPRGDDQAGWPFFIERSTACRTCSSGSASHRGAVMRPEK
jgi:hypothetical protein